MVGLETNPESYGTYTVKWGVEANFCSTESSSAPCLNEVNSPPVTIGTGTIFNNGDLNQAKYVYAGAGVVAPPSPYKACGYYQNDMSFQIYSTNGGLVCSYGSMTDPDTTNANYSYCHSRVTCTVPLTSTPIPPTPTLTLTPTLTPTPLPTLIPTPDFTPTPTSSPTPTQGITPLPSATPILTDTPTVTPTGTLTPSPTPTPTSVATPTSPSGSISTPTSIQPTNYTYTSVPTLIVAKPALLSTGPGETFINLGIFGGLATIIGGLILFGL